MDFYFSGHIPIHEYVSMKLINGGNYNGGSDDGLAYAIMFAVLLFLIVWKVVNG